MRIHRSALLLTLAASLALAIAAAWKPAGNPVTTPWKFDAAKLSDLHRRLMAEGSP